ncbi:unnamed protein product [Mesocestoides corti]|uniref:MOSC domain-containing protein n=1 Tax=Mesocestoides corti TaxID=53468 RepID=A0A0R3UCB4_MESCO|nr:unnamed protein product [Mesocestoides corti]
MSLEKVQVFPVVGGFRLGKLTGSPERPVQIDGARFTERVGHIRDDFVDGDDLAEENGGPQQDYRSHDSRVDGVCVHSSEIQRHWFRLFNRLACRSRSDAWQ